MNNLEKRLIGELKISTDTIEALQVKMMLLKDDKKEAVIEYYNSTQSSADFEELDRMLIICNYQLMISKEQIKIIAHELFINSIEVRK